MQLCRQNRTGNLSLKNTSNRADLYVSSIYIKFLEKDEYYDGLKNADTKGNYDKLYKVFMRETIRSAMKLNKVSIDENLEE